MQWMEWIVHTTTEASELVAEFATQEGARGTSIDDKNDVLNRGESARWDVIDPEWMDALPEDVLVHAFFPIEEAEGAQRAAARLRALDQEDLGLDLGSLVMESRLVDEADWAEHWKRYYKPFRAGKSLVVKPSWESYEAAPEDRVIEIDPGMAFGTGTHETTALCLGLLETWMKPGCVALDLGCGSGILAIAAALLGSRCVVAVDIDPVAVRVARENIARNGLEDRVTACEGDLLHGLEETPDLIVANIIADVILALAGPARARLREGGLFLCSGIILDRAQELREALAAEGYEILEEQTAGEWVAFAARASACTAS